jgi:REP element-mobilizing transposase RayT
VKDRWCCLGTIEDGAVRLSPSGCVVEECWQGLPEQFPGVELDALVIMPNHVHAVLWLTGQDGSLGGGGQHSRTGEGTTGWGQALPEASPGLQSMMADPKLVLGKVIRAWKARSSRLIRLSGDEAFTWQSRYCDHIVRNEAEMARVRQYIANNPARWALDAENPAR